MTLEPVFVDQRSEDELLLRCNCGSNHFVSFERGFHDPLSEWAYIDITAEYRPHANLFGKNGRLHQAWQLLRGGCPWTGNVSLSAEDIIRVRTWCDRTLEYFYSNTL